MVLFWIRFLGISLEVTFYIIVSQTVTFAKRAVSFSLLVFPSWKTAGSKPIFL